MPVAATVPERPAPRPSATLGTPGRATPTPVPHDPFVAPRAVPPPEPKAQSYLEEQYRWQPGDSFAAVSQRFYFTDKYAAALQRYNQEYPLAGPALRQNPAAPPPGQTVWVPPVRILERDYGPLIPNLQPLGPNGVPATPVNRPPGQPVVEPVAVPPPAGAAPGTQLYRVRERGESLYDIAGRTLADRGQWFRVYQLNPALSRDPRLPIPAGTTLRLPAEAKVEAADRAQ